MTRLFLVRHGNTIDEESKKIYKGRLDVPLSRAGLERMERAGAFLASFKIDRVYTSTLSRSIDSGHAVARALGLDIEIEPAFDEVDFGLWEGLSFSRSAKDTPKSLTCGSRIREPILLPRGNRSAMRGRGAWRDCGRS